MHNYTNDALSNDTKVNDFVTLTLKLKIAFGLCCRRGRSVSQTHLDFFIHHVHCTELLKIAENPPKLPSLKSQPIVTSLRFNQPFMGEENVLETAGTWKSGMI